MIPPAARARRGAVVLLDPGCFTPFYDIGLAEHLARRGWAVDWLTSAWEFEDLAAPCDVRTSLLFFRGLHGRLVDRSSLPRRSAPLRRALKALAYPLGLARAARLLASRPPGVLHVQWAHLPMLDAVLWARWRRAGWRIVYTVHDPHPLAGTTPRLLRRAYARLRSAADAVVVHGTAARDEVVREGTPAERVHVVDPGVAPVAGGRLPTRAAARSRLGLPATAPVVLFLGFVKPYKGLEVLLESVTELRRTLPGVRLLVAGAVLDGREQHDATVARLDLGRHVLWSGGYVPDGELGAYLAAADVVALPYLDASSSGVALLAQLHARPVVATRVGDLPELVRDGDTGLLVPPRDAQALARALAELLSDPARAERMGARAHQRAATRFNWTRAAQQVADVYDALLAPAAGCAPGAPAAEPRPHVTA